MTATQALSAGVGSCKITAADASVTDYAFDKFGHPQKVVLSGADAPTQETKTDYYPNGLVHMVTSPEGNSIEFTYDSENANLRSRANIIKIQKHPGPLGGAELVSTSQFE